MEQINLLREIKFANSQQLRQKQIHTVLADNTTAYKKNATQERIEHVIFGQRNSKHNIAVGLLIYQHQIWSSSHACTFSHTCMHVVRLSNVQKVDNAD